MKAEVVVIGGGMAGITAALKLENKGMDVVLAKKSTGATFFSSGAIDVAGYYPLAQESYYKSPKDCINDIIKLNPNHPYSKMGGMGNIESYYKEWKEMIGEEYKLKGSLDKNIRLINFSGTIKPSNLAPNSIYEGDLNNLDGKSLGLVAIEGFPDFNSKYCAKSLVNTISYLDDVEINKVSNYMIKLDYLSDINNLHSLTIAQSLEIEKNLSNFMDTIKTNDDLLKHDVIAFPPILGLMNSSEIIEKIKESLHIEIIELLSYPPSVPGFRLESHLAKLAIDMGIKVLGDTDITSFTSEGRRIKSVSGRYGKYKGLNIEADDFILATGKYIGGGLKEENNFIKESLFNLPIFNELGNPASYNPLQKMFKPNVLPKDGQPFLTIGIKVNDEFQPINEKKQVVFENLKAAGLVLSGYNYVSEKNGLGVAFLTGMAVGGK